MLNSELVKHHYISIVFVSFAQSIAVLPYMFTIAVDSRRLQYSTHIIVNPNLGQRHDGSFLNRLFPQQAAVTRKQQLIKATLYITSSVLIVMLII